MTILDTNVVSELIRHEPDPVVMRNVRSVPSDDLYITAITEAEIRLGLAILPSGRKKGALHARVGLIIERFAGRILPFDSHAARAYAQIAYNRRFAGRPILSLDAQIAGIVESRGGTLLTRNVRDFQGCQFAVINPWDTK